MSFIVWGRFRGFIIIRIRGGVMVLGILSCGGGVGCWGARRGYFDTDVFL